MDEEKLLELFYQVVAFELKHKYYNKTVEKSKLYSQLVAGENLDELLRRFVRRETKELFDQRVNLTQHIVTSISKNLLDVFYKVPRSNSARRLITYEGDDDVSKKVSDLEGILGSFWGDKSWDDYMSTRFIELNSVDPNAFVVFEWDEFDADNEFIQPRPFEVFSEQAVDYKYINNVLQYLIVKQTFKFKKQDEINNTATKLQNPNDNIEKGIKYTLYGKNKTWQLIQLDKKNEIITGELQEAVVFEAVVSGETVNLIQINNILYEYKEFEPHNSDKVPAFRVGYNRDLATNGETFVNPLNSVEPFLLKTIKTNSELDLVASLLAFPQLLKYGQKCEDTNCYMGYYDEDKPCKTCHGTGLKPTAPSAQDAIVIAMPDNKEEVVPLQELITYLRPPVDIVKWQEDYIDKLTAKAKKMMFNSDIFEKKEIAETATGKNLDMQNVYDTLYPFAISFSKEFVFGVKVVANLADRSDKLVVSFTFGKDFKLKSLDSLIIDLSIANKINNASLVKHINDDIAQIIFSEKPLEHQRYLTKEFYNPFAGKSENEVFILLASPFVSRRDKVLHSNYTRVLDELELEHIQSKKDFYKLNRSEQRESIYNKVNEIIVILDSENPLPSFNTRDE